jgi:hypothetical protein
MGFLWHCKLGSVQYSTGERDPVPRGQQEATTMLWQGRRRSSNVEDMRSGGSTQDVMRVLGTQQNQVATNQTSWPVYGRTMPSG